MSVIDDVKVVKGIANAYIYTVENNLEINADDAENAVRACVDSVASALAARIEAGTADGGAYESLIAIMLAHAIIKHAIKRDGADCYKYSDGKITIQEK